MPAVLGLCSCFFFALTGPHAATAQESVGGASRAELVLDLQGFSGLVSGLSLSPDGKLLAAAGGKVVRIWSVDSGELVTTLRGQRQRDSYGNCYCVAFSPDGRELLVGIDDYSDDGSIRVYDTRNFDELRGLLAGHNAPVRRLAFTRDGQYLASAGENGKILVWHWATRRPIGVVEPKDPHQPLYYFFEIPTTEPLLFVSEAGGPSVISLPTAKRLPPGSNLPENLRRWLIGSPSVQFPHQGVPAAMSLKLERGVWLAGGKGKKEGRDCHWVALFGGAAAAPVRVYESHRYVVTAAVLNRTGTLAATADVLGDIHLWDTNTGTTRHVFRSLGRPVYRAACDSAGRTIGLGTTPFATGRWNRNSFAAVEQVFDFDKRRTTPAAQQAYPQEVSRLGNRLLEVALVDDIYRLNCSGQGVLAGAYKIRAGASPMCYTFLRAPRLGINTPVVTGDDSGGVLCYNPDNNEERRDFVGHDSFVTSLSESADGRLLATSSTDRTIRIWSLENYRPTGDVDFKYLSDSVIEVKPGTSAARAGVSVGDRFVSMDGLDLTELSRRKLNGTYNYQPGQRVPVVLQRAGQAYQVELTLKEGADLAEPLLSLFFAGENDWVIWTPQGYYDASPGADRLIGWHVNQGPEKSAKYYPAHQFRKQLYRPDVIDLMLETGSVAEAVRKANAVVSQPPPALDLRQPEVLQNLEPPQVRIVAPADGTQTQTSPIALLAQVESQNELPITDVTVLVNGRPVTSKGIVREGPATGTSHSVVEQVPLLPGTNEISVLASNSASSSRPATVTVTYQPPQSEVARPDLYLLAIGISEYARKDLNLTFAHSDAEAFTAAWEGQRGHVYRNVAAKVITNEQASVQNILGGMDWLVKSVTQRDVAVMFISAHGLRDSRQNYYLAAHGIDPENLRSTGVRFSEVKELLRDLPCKVMLFVDTCHSGGVTGAKNVGWDDPLHDLVSEEYGAVVFSSSLPREVSLENPQWGHGAFTRALLDTFRSAESDNNRDGYLSITELEDHVYRRVKQLTKGKQHPVVERPPTIRNFNFYKLG